MWLCFCCGEDCQYSASTVFTWRSSVWYSFCLELTGKQIPHQVLEKYFKFLGCNNWIWCELLKLPRSGSFYKAYWTWFWKTYEDHIWLWFCNKNRDNKKRWQRKNYSNWWNTNLQALCRVRIQVTNLWDIMYFNTDMLSLVFDSVSLRFV